MRETDSAMAKGNKNQAVMSAVREVFRSRTLWENGAEKNMFRMGSFLARLQKSYLNLAVKDGC